MFEHASRLDVSFDQVEVFWLLLPFRIWVVGSSFHRLSHLQHLVFFLCTFAWIEVDYGVDYAVSATWTEGVGGVPICWRRSLIHIFRQEILFLGFFYSLIVLMLGKTDIFHETLRSMISRMRKNLLVHSPSVLSPFGFSRFVSYSLVSSSFFHHFLIFCLFSHCLTLSIWLPHLLISLCLCQCMSSFSCASVGLSLCSLYPISISHCLFSQLLLHSWCILKFSLTEVISSFCWSKDRPSPVWENLIYLSSQSKADSDGCNSSYYSIGDRANFYPKLDQTEKPLFCSNCPSVVRCLSFSCLPAFCPCRHLLSSKISDPVSRASTS